MTDPKLQAAYDACAREPIHLSGAIQPHGVLLAFAPRSGEIVAASDNAGELFATDAQALLGQAIDELFDSHALELVRANAAASQPGDFPRLAGLVNAGAWGELHYLSVHVRAQLIHVELEPAARDSGEPLDAHAMIARLETGAQAAPFFQAVATQVRELTGYDRVMVYAFRRDHSGEVVAQALGGELSSYLGLRFPASDIPPQARALYLANRVRVIPDAGYAPVPVHTAAQAAPLDMSFDLLRSVSPIHLEYLRNMGVRASMSISLIVDGRLWGLIACHHPQPRPVGPRERIAADVFGRYVSLLLGTRNLKQIGAAEAAARLHRDRLEQALARSPSPWATLREQSEALLGALGADAAALVAGDGALLARADFDPAALAPALPGADARAPRPRRHRRARRLERRRARAGRPVRDAARRRHRRLVAAVAQRTDRTRALGRLAGRRVPARRRPPDHRPAHQLRRMEPDRQRHRRAVVGGRRRARRTRAPAAVSPLGRRRARPRTAKPAGAWCGWTCTATAGAWCGWPTC
nr:GAF domain-containing protein [Lysobacter enzymogenes]